MPRYRSLCLLSSSNFLLLRAEIFPTFSAPADRADFSLHAAFPSYSNLFIRGGIVVTVAAGRIC